MHAVIFFTKLLIYSTNCLHHVLKLINWRNHILKLYVHIFSQPNYMFDVGKEDMVTEVSKLTLHMALPQEQHLDAVIHVFSIWIVRHLVNDFWSNKSRDQPECYPMQDSRARWRDTRRLRIDTEVTSAYLLLMQMFQQCWLTGGPVKYTTYTNSNITITWCNST